MLKWILAILGLMFLRGLPGAIIGFLVGSLLEYFLGNSSIGKQVGSAFKQETKVSPGDFELNLLTLSSVIIKADGSVNQHEMEYVQRYFVNAYGKERANATFKTFNEVVKNRQIDPARICAYLHMRTTYEVRLQILHFLFGIAQADGSISRSELNQLELIAGYLRLTRSDYESIKAMFVTSRKTGTTNAYKILEVEKTASEAEIKKAYRKMVKKYHPDKLQHMDEVYQKGAREKFNKVQEAYEQIQQERGF